MIHEFFIYTENKKMSDLGVENKSVAPISINMQRVESVWRNVHDDTGGEGATITLFSGDNFTVNEGYDTVMQVWRKALGK